MGREMTSLLGLIKKIDTVHLGNGANKATQSLDASGSFTTKSTFLKLTKTNQKLASPLLDEI